MCLPFLWVASRGSPKSRNRRARLEVTSRILRLAGFSYCLVNFFANRSSRTTGILHSIRVCSNNAGFLHVKLLSLRSRLRKNPPSGSAVLGKQASHDGLTHVNKSGLYFLLSSTACWQCRESAMCQPHLIRDDTRWL